MTELDACEVAYKNGYLQAYKDLCELLHKLETKEVTHLDLAVITETILKTL